MNCVATNFSASGARLDNRDVDVGVTRRRLMPSAIFGFLITRVSMALGSSNDDAAVFFPSPEAVIESGTIFAEKFGGGGGLDLILIPGLAGGAWSWGEMARSLSPNHTVYALTLAGFDGRPAIAAPIIDRVVTDIARFIEERRLQKPILIGHSLGAFIALRLGIEHGALIRGLVTIDGYPVFPPLADAHAEERRAAAERLAQQFRIGTNVEEFRGLMRKFLATRMNDPERAARLADRAAKSDPGATAQYVLEMLSADLRPKLGRLKPPLLALAAVNSYKNELSEAEIRTFYRKLLANAPNFSILLIRNARHFAVEDQPEVVGAAIEGFLAGLLSSAC
jgi:N-formylmaleamate deformylase